MNIPIESLSLIMLHVGFSRHHADWNWQGVSSPFIRLFRQTVGISPQEYRRHNDKEEYILMYDLYGSGRYEFQRSTDLYTFTEQPESFTKDFFPRHGTIMSVTAEELERLKASFELR